MDQCDIVVDVGAIYDHDKKRYDHHQQGRAGQRENTVYYSGLGLVWKHYGLDWCGGDQEVYEFMDKELVEFVDAEDNGQDVYELTELKVAPVTIADIVTWYRPTYGEDQDFDGRFMKAVDMATDVLEQLHRRAVGSVKAAKQVQAIYDASPDKRYIIMDEFIPLGDFPEHNPELLFTVYPDPSGRWAIKTIRKEQHSFANRKDLPASWGGLRADELAEVTGIPDALFCHNALFVASAVSKESALKMLELALAD